MRKPAEPLPVAKRPAADAADLDAHRQIAWLLAKLPREQMHVAIGGGIDALDPAAGDAPILQWVGPIFGAEPDAVGRVLPVAFELGRGGGRRRRDGQSGGNCHGRGCSGGVLQKVASGVAVCSHNAMVTKALRHWASWESDRVFTAKLRPVRNTKLYTPDGVSNIIANTRRGDSPCKLLARLADLTRNQLS